MKRWGIRGKVMFIALTPAATIAIVLATYFIRTQIGSLEHELTERGTILAQQLAPAAEYGVISANTTILKSLAQSALAEPDVVSVSITTASGVRLVRVTNARGQTPGTSDQVFHAPIAQSEVPVSDFGALTRTGHPPEKPRIIGWVTVALSHRTTTIAQHHALLDSLLITALGLAISATLALRMSRSVTGPIFRLHDTVRHLGEGNLDARVATDSSGELAALEHGVNSMAEGLQEAHTLMQSRIDASTAELRSALNNLELQNAELDAARKQALDASRVKSEFMANMSHEIRTPMNGIIGFTNLLLKTPLSEAQHEDVEAIRQSAATLMAVINDILDFSKIASGNLQLECIDFDLRGVLDDAIGNLAPAAYDKGLDLVSMFYSDVPRHLRGDPARIRQVLSNLAGNGIKFTNHGSVSVRVMLEDETDGSATVKVSVTDTGIGLSLKDQKRLFTSFSQADTSATRQFGGIGVGLVICRKLVEYMGGEIGLESQLGKGSTFWFTFTCTKSERPVSVMPPRNPLAGLSAIVCDPMELSCLALTHQLADWNVAVTTAETADGLQDLLDRSLPTKSLPFVLVGLSRFELETEKTPAALAVLDGARHGPVVVLASTLDKGIQNRLRLQGADLVLPKIVRPEELYTRLVSLLFAPSTEAPAADAKQSGATTNLTGLKILVVDDNKINRKLVTALYTLHGASVTEAENGSVAVQKAASTQFDLVYMDIHMPVMSGIEATARIRAMEQAGHRTPIVALTANAMRGEKDRLIRCGLDDCLIKPMQEEDLWNITWRWVDPDKLDIGQARKPTPAAGRSAPKNHDRSPRAALAEPKSSYVSPASDRRKAIRIAGGNVQLADELLAMLIKELPQFKTRLNTALAARDLAAVGAEAHKVNGAALYCAVEGIQQCANRLERAANDGDLAEAQACMKELNRQIDGLLHEHA